MKKGRGCLEPRPPERLGLTVYPLTVARDYILRVGEHLIVPAPAGDDVFPRRIVARVEGVVAGTAKEGVQRPPLDLPVSELVVATPATDDIRSPVTGHHVGAGAAAHYVSRRRPFHQALHFARLRDA